MKAGKPKTDKQREVNPYPVPPNHCVCGRPMVDRGADNAPRCQRCKDLEIMLRRETDAAVLQSKRAQDPFENMDLIPIGFAKLLRERCSKFWTDRDLEEPSFEFIPSFNQTQTS